MDPTDTYRPKARALRLLVEEFEDETLVYDLESHKAYCLNPTAAHVFALADGERTLEEIAEALPEVEPPADVALVEYALDELGESGLLERGSVEPNGPAPAVGLSRRQAMRAMGLAAGATLLFPVVDSITAPLAAQAASCLTNAQCRAQPKKDCTGLPICSARTFCCQKRGKKRRASCTALPC